MISAVLAFTSILAADRCYPVTGDRVTAGDLAEASSAWAEVPGDTVLGLAPEAGRRRIFTPEELIRLSRTTGVPLPALRSVCVERPTKALTGEAVIQALQRAIGRDGARIELLDFSRFAIPEGEIVFPRSGLANAAQPEREQGIVWKGHVSYGKSDRFPIWARARITLEGDGIQVIEPIRTGAAIRPEQIRVGSQERLPLFSPVITDPDAVRGKISKRWLAPGTILEEGMIESSPDIVRGKTVDVQAIFGPIRFRFKAKADMDGKVGQAITLKNSDSGRSFRGRVESKNTVIVDQDVNQ